MKPSITSYIKFSFQFNTEKLLQDLTIASKNTWILHFNTGGYEGDWKVISLYAPNGEANNIFAHSTENAVLKETPILGQCLYFKEVISFFKAPILSARILKLSPQAVIKPHRDYLINQYDPKYVIKNNLVIIKSVRDILERNNIKRYTFYKPLKQKWWEEQSNNKCEWFDTGEHYEDIKNHTLGYLVKKDFWKNQNWAKAVYYD